MFYKMFNTYQKQGTATVFRRRLKLNKQIFFLVSKMSSKKTDKHVSDSTDDVEHRSPELTLVQSSTGENEILIVHSLRSGLALAGAALAYFATVGFLNAFGVFQEYYTSDVLSDHSDFQISWVRCLLYPEFDDTQSQIRSQC